jgi:hypothetical protein
MPQVVQQLIPHIGVKDLLFIEFCGEMYARKMQNSMWHDERLSETSGPVRILRFSLQVTDYIHQPDTGGAPGAKTFCMAGIHVQIFRIQPK